MYIGFIRKKKYLKAFVDKELWERIVPSLSNTRRFWKGIIVIVNLCLLILVLMRPQYGLKFEKVTRKGQEILIALDISLSMQAQDVGMSRFEHAKREIVHLIENLEGDRVGLVIFSGSAYLQCPLTIDYSALKLFLEDINVGMLSLPGSNLSEAIKVARESFNKKRKSRKVLIILSDGEYFEGDPVNEAREAFKEGISIYTVGLGTKSGEPLPIKDEKGNVLEFKKDKDEKVVLSKLNELGLKNMAKMTGGEYYFSNERQMVMNDLYKDISSQERKEMEDKMFQRYIDRYQFFLAIIFILLLLDFILVERKKARSLWKGRI
jgi:Ca-activated chloride channel family protein